MKEKFINNISIEKRKCIDIYKVIKYLIIAFLILMSLIYTCAYRNEKFYEHYEVEEDMLFMTTTAILFVTKFIMTFNVAMGVLMHLVYDRLDSKIKVLKFYINTSYLAIVLNIIQTAAFAFVFTDYSWGNLGELVFGSYTKMPYRMLAVQYVIAILFNIITILILASILICSRCELKKIELGISDRYFDEKNGMIKSKIKVLFCVLNVAMIVILVLDTSIMAFILYGVSFTMVILLLNSFIMYDKKIKALITYLMLFYSIYISLYNNMWYESWQEQLFVIVMSIIIVLYVIYIIMVGNRERIANLRFFIMRLGISMAMVVITAVGLIYKYTDRINSVIETDIEKTIEKKFESMNELDIPENARVLVFKNDKPSQYDEEKLYVELELNARDYEYLIYEFGPTYGDRSEFKEKGLDTKNMMYVSYRKLDDKTYLGYFDIVKNGKFKMIIEVY